MSPKPSHTRKMESKTRDARTVANVVREGIQMAEADLHPDRDVDLVAVVKRPGRAVGAVGEGKHDPASVAPGDASLDVAE